MAEKWLADVFSFPNAVGALAIAGKTVIIYLFLVFGLRLLGKRELGQMTVYDLVLIIVLANSVQNAMLGNDNTLGGGLVAAITLLLLNRLFTLLLLRSPRFERRMVGEPQVIISDGHVSRDRLAREGIAREQVMAALREHGLERIEDVRLGVLEVDGTISIVPRGTTVHRTRRHVKALHFS